MRRLSGIATMQPERRRATAVRTGVKVAEIRTIVDAGTLFAFQEGTQFFNPFLLLQCVV